MSRWACHSCARRPITAPPSTSLEPAAPIPPVWSRPCDLQQRSRPATGRARLRLTTIVREDGR